MSILWLNWGNKVKLSRLLRKLTQASGYIWTYSINPRSGHNTATVPRSTGLKASLPALRPLRRHFPVLLGDFNDPHLLTNPGQGREHEKDCWNFGKLEADHNSTQCRMWYRSLTTTPFKVGARPSSKTMETEKAIFLLLPRQFHGTDIIGFG